MKRLLLILPLLVLCLFYDTDDALACSGGGNGVLTLNLVNDSEFIVRGSVIEASGGNSIVRVDRYLAGSGANQLFIYRNSPGYWVGRNLRGYDYGCGIWQSPMVVNGVQMILGLNRNLNGTYAVEFTMPIIPTEDDFNVSYLNYDGDIHDRENHSADNWQPITTSVREFEARLEEITGQFAVLPEPVFTDSPYYPELRRRVLYITTENGTHYMMPIDSGAVVEIDPPCSENCPIFAPDYSHALYPIPVEENTYAVTYHTPSTYDWYEGYSRFSGDDILEFRPNFITAESVLFSPDSNFVIGWTDNVLSLYQIRIGFNNYYGDVPNIYDIAQFELSTENALESAELQGNVAWSGNSRVLVYWDTEGLHWFDLLSMDSSRIVEDVPRPERLEVSQSGRYVLYGDRNNWLLMDIFTGTQWENAIITPDEGRILHFYTPDENATFDVTDGLHTNLPIDTQSLIEWHWREFERQGREYHQLTIIAVDDNEGLCLGYYTLSPLDNHFAMPCFLVRSSDEHYVAQIIVDDVHGAIVARYSDGLITEYLNTIITFAELDSPIASISWGEPLWYVEG